VIAFQICIFQNSDHSQYLALEGIIRFVYFGLYEPVNMPSATPDTDITMQEAEEQDSESLLLGDTKKLIVVSRLET
jgi:hypothetical protein